ncbi:hypothetical protein [Anaerocolumna aminovalerica]|nr:hypothetical protein [Anaerocolumna aminovalerica]
MLFVAEQNGKYIRGLMNLKGDIVYSEVITEREYRRYINIR